MEINFDKSLYSSSAIKRAMRDYRNLATLFYREQKDQIKVKISGIRDKELRPFFKEEFSNYVLALSGVEK